MSLGTGAIRRLVGVPWKYKAQQGGSMTALWVGILGQPCKWLPTSTVTLKKLQDLQWTRGAEDREANISKLQADFWW